MSTNQALSNYREILPELGNKLYLIIAIIFLNYVVIGYLMIFTLAPKFLLKGKYIQFACCLILAAMAFIIIPGLIPGKYTNNYGAFSNIAILDKINELFFHIFAIFGITTPVFLKNWMLESQRVSELEKNRASSELEQLKEQINPVSFFSILNRTGMLVKTEPDRASAMLMKLSQLLRYQLYDCNRNQVLLTAEIAFIRNFLDMERLYDPQFNYSIETTGNLHTKFIPPTILLPYVQGVMKAFDATTKENNTLNIRIDNNDKEVCFVLTMSGNYIKDLLDTEIVRLNERLELLFKENYTLSVKENSNTSGIAEICLKLYNNSHGAGKK
jgi:LytS/YehU family sensor histidine kinase